MEDRRRGRPAGGRASGRPNGGGQQQSRGPGQQSRGPGQQQAWGPPQQQQPQQGAWGPPLQQQAPQQAAPQQQGAWARARGRGVPATGAPAEPAPAPQPVAQVTQQMAGLNVGQGDAAAAGTRGTSEPTRGTVRQRKIDDETFRFRSQQLASKSGTKGNMVTLQSNVFKLKKLEGVTLLQYRVDFEPDIDVTRQRKGILHRYKDNFGRAYIFDGTVLYTMQRLPEGFELTHKDERNDSIIRIKIKLTTDLQMGDHNYLQFLNLILRNCLGKMDYELVARDYYNEKAKINLPDCKLEIWPGFLTSLRQCDDGIMMVTDLSFKVMRHETAYALLLNCRQRSQDNWKEIFENAIIGSVVITRYNNRTYRVDDVDWAINATTTFDMKGRKISYKDYFREKYNLKVEAPDQPILVSKPKEKDIRGGRGDKNIHLLPEFTCLTGIDDSMRANFTTMKAIAEHTRVPPRERIQRLENGFMNDLTKNPKCAEELNTWHMAFEPRLTNFQGRVLPKEKIIVGDNKSFETEGETGDFTRTLVSKKYRLPDPGELKQWIVVFPQRIQHREVANFCQTLNRAAQSIGFHIPEPEYQPLNDDRSGTYVNAIEGIVRSGQFTLVMAIVPNNRAERYEAIKKKCYVQRSIPNQVVLAKNVSKNNMSVCTKIAIQMSCKIGGTPWMCHIPFNKGNTMIVGFDVCHDTRFKNRSVGALVATMNKNYSRYYSTVAFHESGEELSSFIASQMMTLLLMYQQNEGAIPDRIFFYRDAVGEGNLHYVLENEVYKIRDLFKSAYGIDIPLTFIVVSKRINFRFFLNQGNPPPGTVVDTTVTLPNLYDFFLVSQSVRQGTVSPTSYNVIYDSQNIRPDIVQQLSYKLTHMYYNWSGTVRVPAPCQYAHKLAFLVGQHLHTAPTGMHDILYYL